MCVVCVCAQVCMCKCMGVVSMHNHAGVMMFNRKLKISWRARAIFTPWNCWLEIFTHTHTSMHTWWVCKGVHQHILSAWGRTRMDQHMHSFISSLQCKVWTWGYEPKVFFFWKTSMLWLTPLETCNPKPSFTRHIAPNYFTFLRKKVPLLIILLNYYKMLQKWPFLA